MKIVSWNLNHRARHKRIPDDIVDVFTAFDADVILLNEFVDRPTGGPFYASLEAAGFTHQLLSFTPGLHNQVFAAARQPIFLGDIEPPSFDGSAISNFLHIRFDDPQMELVGLRVPAYEKRPDQRNYDSQLLEIMQRVGDRAIVFTGDFNKDQFLRTKQPDAPEIAYPGCAAYRMPNPVGTWSYMNSSGQGTSRIDHVVHTQGVTVGSPEYVSELNGRVLAGPKTASPISDHAALKFTMVPTLSVAHSVASRAAAL